MTEETLTCNRCGKELTGGNAIRVGPRNYCTECLQKVADYIPKSFADGPKSPGIAFVLSLFAGLGHLYLGYVQKGLLLMVIYVVSFSFPPLSAIVFFYAAFDAMNLAKRLNQGEEVEDIDIRAIISGEKEVLFPSNNPNAADKAAVSSEETVSSPAAPVPQVMVVKTPRKKKDTTFWGGILILLGAVFLLQNLGFAEQISELWPLLLIGAGLWILYENLTGNGKDQPK